MFNRKEIKEKAKSNFKANYWLCVLVAFIFGVLRNGYTIVSYIRKTDVSFVDTLKNGADTIYTSSVHANINPLFGLVGLALVWLVLNPIILGCRKFFLANTHEKSELEDLGYAFKTNYGNIVLTIILTEIYTLLWTLLFIIPGIVKMYSYCLVPYILAENPNMKPNEAITKSRQMMDGNKMDAFVLSLSFIGWSILSTCTCGILGVFYVNPYIMQSFAEMYKQIKETKQISDNIHNNVIRTEQA